jgi:signal transduction histidine kinase/ligand-binding sensor domain-containing protein
MSRSATVCTQKSTRRRFMAWCIASIACWSLMSSACAVDPAQTLDELDHAVFTPREGAPGGIVDLAQTPDGYLWLASDAGLFSFDGMKFQQFKQQDGPELRNDAVSAILVDRTGDLWVGFRFGGVSNIHDGQVRAYGFAEGLPKHSVFEIVEDKNENKWAATSVGLFQLQGTKWHEVKAIDGTSMRAEGYRELKVDQSGNLWFAAASGVFCRHVGTESFVLVRPHRELAGIVLCPDGSVWIYDEQGVQSLAGAHFDLAKHKASSWPSEKVKPEFVFFDSRGSVWGYTDVSPVRTSAHALLQTQSVPTIWPAVEHLARDQRISGTTPMAFFEDREGNVWLATDGGIDRFRSNKFSQASIDGQLISSAALAAGSENTLWIGTDAFGLLEKRDRIQRTGVLSGSGSNYGVLSIHYSAKGTVWAGGRSRLWRSKPAGGYEEVELPSLGARFDLQAIATDDDDGVWVSIVPKSIFRLRKGIWTVNGGINDIHDGPALSLSFDHEAKRLWIGYPDNQIAVVSNEHAKYLGPIDGLSVGNVLAFCPQSGGMWVGGSGGVAYFDGSRFHPFLGEGDRKFAGASGLVVSKLGELWINGSQGASRIPAAELAEFLKEFSYRVSFESFSVLDGLEGLPESIRPIPSTVMTTDGRLWFSTVRGLYSIDPAHIQRNKLAPDVRVLDVIASGHSLALAKSVWVPKKTSSLQIDYTASNLGAPDAVRFRYKLDGVDHEWQIAGGRRQAFYTNLPPGSYTFHVIASNEDGVWNDQGATITLILPAAFWQTWWFEVACGVAAAILVWSLYLARLRLASDRLQVRMRDRAEERETIARDLHDTLLQGTQGLVLNFQVVAGQLPRDDDRRKRLEALLDQADQVIAQARDRVFNLRDRYTADVDLLGGLTTIGLELAAGTEIGFSIASEGDVRRLSELLRAEVYMIGREALLNAFRHSGARSVDLQVACDSRGFVLSVCDNGVGLDAETQRSGSRPGHWGLVGMRERAERVRGRLEVLSEPDKGTQVRLLIPADVAFPDDGILSPLRRTLRFLRR